jgi:hypothetical protein
MPHAAGFRRDALMFGDEGRVMSIRNWRLLLLSSSALVLLCFAGVASSQAPETPPTTTAPETPPAEPPAPQPQQPAQPETPPPGTAPTVSVPQVTVEAPKRRPPRRAAPATPVRTAAPRPAPAPTPTPPTAPTTPPTTTTAGQPAAASPFQPPPSLNVITGSQIQASPAQSFGNLFFTMPGATSAGLARRGRCCAGSNPKQSVRYSRFFAHGAVALNSTVAGGVLISPVEGFPECRLGQ